MAVAVGEGLSTRAGAVYCVMPPRSGRPGSIYFIYLEAVCGEGVNVCPRPAPARKPGPGKVVVKKEGLVYTRQDVRRRSGPHDTRPQQLEQLDAADTRYTQYTLGSPSAAGGGASGKAAARSPEEATRRQGQRRGSGRRGRPFRRWR